MYWGNPLGAAGSSGPSVFGDYALVFHMTEDSDNSSTQIQDASGHGNAGHVQDPPKTNLRDSDGIAGDGLDLDGVGTYVTTSIRDSAPKSVSISLWLKTNGPSEGGIVGFGSTEGGDQQVLYDRAIEMDSQGRMSFSVRRDGTLATVSSLGSYGDGKWHFVVARLSSAGQYLFVDGEDVADDPATTNADPYDGLWRFGEEPDLSPPSPAPDASASTGNFIFGSLDEARITIVETSDAWIKLSFATQRPDATALGYLPQ
jgi:hypothetical protein